MVVQIKICDNCEYFDKYKSRCNYFKDEINFQVFECSDYKKNDIHNV